HTDLYTLSLHDALRISRTKMKCRTVAGTRMRMCDGPRRTPEPYGPDAFKAERLGLGTLETGRRLLKSPHGRHPLGLGRGLQQAADRKSTRLNSSHVKIS